MKAMRLLAPGTALKLAEATLPPPQDYQVRLDVQACGVCRTDLHLLDNELPDIHYPVTPGHEIVGTVVDAGPAVTRLAVGDRVGVAWLGYACGVCRYWRQGREDLCEDARFTRDNLD